MPDDITSYTDRPPPVIKEYPSRPPTVSDIQLEQEKLNKMIVEALDGPVLHRPSLAVRAAKKTWRGTPAAALGFTILSIALELAARALAKHEGSVGPIAAFFRTLADIFSS